jgi:hypothetical protein
MSWLGSHAMSLLWMLVVGVTACVIYASAVALARRIFLEIAQGRKWREEEFQRAGARQQQYWKERHRHAHPECEVCKAEAEHTRAPRMHRRIVERE